MANNKKQKLLKGLLATAMLTGAANSAMAVPINWTYTTTGAAAYNAAANLDVNGGGVDVAVGAAVVAGIGSAIPNVLQAYITATPFVAGSITDGGGLKAITAGDTINLSLGHAFNFTNGGTSIGVRNIDYTANVGASVTDDTTVSGNITNGGSTGSVKFAAAKTFTVAGTVGGVGTVDFNGKAATFKLTGSGTSAAGMGAYAGFSAGVSDSSGGVSTGTLQFSGDYINASGAISRTTAVTIDAGKHVRFGNAAGNGLTATTTTLGGAGSVMILDSTVAAYNVSGNIVTGAAGTGVVYTRGGNAVTITGNVGAGTSNVAAFVADTAAGVTTTVGGPLYAQLVQVGASNTVDAYSIGASGAGVASVLRVTGGVTAPVSFMTDGVLRLADATNLSGGISNNVGTSSNGTLYLEGGSTIATQVGSSGAGTLKAVSLDGVAKTVAVTADIYATNVQFVTAATAASILQLGSAGAGKKITGNVNNTAGANIGILQVYKGSEVTGNIGNTNALAAITFMEAGTVTIGGTVVKAPVNFAGYDGVLNLTSTGASDVTVTGGVSNTTTNYGTIKAANITAGNSLIFVGGPIGTSNLAVKSIDAGLAKVSIDAGAGGTANVTNIKAAELTLAPATAGATYTVGYSDGVLNLGANALSIGASSNFANMSKIKFTGDALVTVGEGVAIKATAIDNATDGHGNLLFTGNGTFDAPCTRSISGIGMGATAASKVLAIKQNVQFGSSLNTVNFAAGNTVSDAVIEIYSNNVAGGRGLDVLGASGGTFAFKNTNAITVAGAFNTTGAFGGAASPAITIDAGNVTFTNVGLGAGGPGDTSNARSLTFTDKANKDTTLTLQGVSNTNFQLGLITTAKDGYGIIEVDGSVDTTGTGTSAYAYGADGKRLQAFRMTADSTLTVGPSVTIYGDIRVKTDNTGTVAFTGVHDKVYGIGESGKAVKAITFDSSTTLLGNVYGKGATFAPAAASSSTLTLGSTNGGIAFNSPLQLGASNTTATLAVTNGSTIGGAVTAKGATNATINFADSGAFTAQLGDATNPMFAVNFGGSGKVVKAGADVFATNINQAAGSIVQLTQAAKFTVAGGSHSVSSATIDAGVNTLTVSGGKLALSGNVTLAATATVDANGSVTGGGVVLDSTATAAAAASTAGTVSITLSKPSGTLAKSGESLTVLSASASDAGTTGAVNTFTTLTKNGFGDFDTAKIERTASTVKVVLGRDASVLVANMSGAGADAMEFAKGLVAQENTLSGDALRFLGALGDMTPAERKDAVTRQAQVAQGSVAAAQETTSVVNAALGARMANVASGMGAMPSTDHASLGTAAGDEARSMGAWGTVIGGVGTQKQRKGEAGFKSSMVGGLVGFDTAVNESTTVGIAAAIANTTLKHKDAKAGDKTKATTYMFALYGTHEFGGNWIAQGSAMFGNSSVKNTEKHIVARGGVTQNSTGKTDTMTYAVEALGGYRYAMAESANITPMAGLKYAKFNSGGYTETGTAYQNRTVSKKGSDKFAGTLGARLDYTTQMGDAVITPEVHAFVDYDFKAKATKVDVRMNGYNGSVSSRGVKPAHLSWNLGTSVMAKSGMFEYGAGYDLSLSDKYIGHQGALKLRVNF